MVYQNPAQVRLLQMGPLNRYGYHGIHCHLTVTLNIFHTVCRPQNIYIEQDIRRNIYAVCMQYYDIVLCDCGFKLNIYPNTLLTVSLVLYGISSLSFLKKQNRFEPRSCSLWSNIFTNVLPIY